MQRRQEPLDAPAAIPFIVVGESTFDLWFFNGCWTADAVNLRNQRWRQQWAQAAAHEQSTEWIHCRAAHSPRGHRMPPTQNAQFLLSLSHKCCCGGHQQTQRPVCRMLAAVMLAHDRIRAGATGTSASTSHHSAGLCCSLQACRPVRAMLTGSRRYTGACCGGGHQMASSSGAPRQQGIGVSSTGAAAVASTGGVSFSFAEQDKKDSAEGAWGEEGEEGSGVHLGLRWAWGSAAALRNGGWANPRRELSLQPGARTPAKKFGGEKMKKGVGKTGAGRERAGAVPPRCVQRPQRLLLASSNVLWLALILR